MTDEIIERVDDHYLYLKAAIITLGVAAGIVAVALWGSFSSPIRAVLSLAIFPVVLGIAFFAVFLAISLFRSRHASLMGILTLSLIAILLLLFPTIYVPHEPLDVQMQRLSIIPIGTAMAVMVGFFLVKWMDRRGTMPRLEARYGKEK